MLPTLSIHKEEGDEFAHTLRDGHDRDEKQILFTCDHMFSSSQFYQAVLPKFQQLLSKLNDEETPSVRLPDSLLLADYQQPGPNLACPVCVYHSLRHDYDLASVLPVWQL